MQSVENSKKWTLSRLMKTLVSLSQPYSEWGELALRVGVACFMLSHGFGKLVSFSNIMPHFPDPLGIGSMFSLGLATFAEFFCSILLMIGLLTRFAAFNLLATMSVAGFIVHSADPFSKKELAFLYAIVFVYFLLVGGNRYSVDQQLRKYLN